MGRERERASGRFSHCAAGAACFGTSIMLSCSNTTTIFAACCVDFPLYPSTWCWWWWCCCWWWWFDAPNCPRLPKATHTSWFENALSTLDDGKLILEKTASDELHIRHLSDNLCIEIIETPNNWKEAGGNFSASLTALLQHSKASPSICGLLAAQGCWLRAAQKEKTLNIFESRWIKTVTVQVVPAQGPREWRCPQAAEERTCWAKHGMPSITNIFSLNGCVLQCWGPSGSLILQALAEVVNQSLGAQALPVLRPIRPEVCVQCTDVYCICLGQVAPASFHEPRIWWSWTWVPRPATPKPCILPRRQLNSVNCLQHLTAIFQLGQMPSGWTTSSSRCGKTFSKKTRQRRYHALHGDFVALPGVKVLWLEEYFIKNGLGP